MNKRLNNLLLKILGTLVVLASALMLAEAARISETISRPQQLGAWSAILCVWAGITCAMWWRD